jgi:hypothetical protein
MLYFGDIIIQPPSASGAKHSPVEALQMSSPSTIVFAPFMNPRRHAAGRVAALMCRQVGAAQTIVEDKE